MTLTTEQHVALDAVAAQHPTARVVGTFDHCPVIQPTTAERRAFFERDKVAA